MTAEAMTAEQAQAIQASHVSRKSAVGPLCASCHGPERWPCLPYRLAAAYLAASEDVGTLRRGLDAASLWIDKAEAERDQARAELAEVFADRVTLGRSYDQLRTELATAVRQAEDAELSLKTLKAGRQSTEPYAGPQPLWRYPYRVQP
jgi:hypothetical protein